MKTAQPVTQEQRDIYKTIEDFSDGPAVYREFRGIVLGDEVTFYVLCDANGSFIELGEENVFQCDFENAFSSATDAQNWLNSIEDRLYDLDDAFVEEYELVFADILWYV